MEVAIVRGSHYPQDWEGKGKNLEVLKQSWEENLCPLGEDVR